MRFSNRVMKCDDKLEPNKMVVVGSAGKSSTNPALFNRGVTIRRQINEAPTPQYTVYPIDENRFMRIHVEETNSIHTTVVRLDGDKLIEQEPMVINVGAVVPVTPSVVFLRQETSGELYFVLQYNFSTTSVRARVLQVDKENKISIGEEAIVVSTTCHSQTLVGVTGFSVLSVIETNNSARGICGTVLRIDGMEITVCTNTRISSNYENNTGVFATLLEQEDRKKIIVVSQRAGVGYFHVISVSGSDVVLNRVDITLSGLGAGNFINSSLTTIDGNRAIFICPTGSFIYGRILEIQNGNDYEMSIGESKEIHRGERKLIPIVNAKNEIVPYDDMIYWFISPLAGNMYGVEFNYNEIDIKYINYAHDDKFIPNKQIFESNNYDRRSNTFIRINDRFTAGVYSWRRQSNFLYQDIIDMEKFQELGVHGNYAKLLGLSGDEQSIHVQGTLTGFQNLIAGVRYTAYNTDTGELLPHKIKGSNGNIEEFIFAEPKLQAISDNEMLIIQSRG